MRNKTYHCQNSAEIQ